MGFTPLEGLVMATRSGSVDPGMLVWLLNDGRLSVAQLADGLEGSSGLAGLAALPGGSGDMRDVRAAADRGDHNARMAIGVYLHRLRGEIAAMAAAMNGLDALVFTGGIGEHDPALRAAAATGLAFLGVAIDDDSNGAALGDTDISAPGSAVHTVVITAREDIVIADQTRAVLRKGTAT
jgi:acetate kinase